MNITIRQMIHSWRWRVYRNSLRLHRDILKEGHAVTRKEANQAAEDWAKTKAGKVRRVVKRTDRPWDWYVYGAETSYYFGRSETKAHAEIESKRTAKLICP